MKVFVPHELLEAQGELEGGLVPFNPEFIRQPDVSVEERKPNNWIDESDYSAACERLYASA
jgi:hypothetical protein